MNEVAELLKKARGEVDVPSFVHFNDHADTTKQDVLNLFDKALADLGEL